MANIDEQLEQHDIMQMQQNQQMNQQQFQNGTTFMTEAKLTQSV